MAAPGSGRSTYEKSPIEPGMSTGWPVVSQRVPASIGWPAGSARVAPLRCTQTGCVEQVGMALLLHEVVADLVDELGLAAEGLRERAPPPPGR